MPVLKLDTRAAQKAKGVRRMQKDAINCGKALYNFVADDEGPSVAYEIARGVAKKVIGG
jgi:hypothetical protein